MDGGDKIKSMNSIVTVGCKNNSTCLCGVIDVLNFLLFHQLMDIGHRWIMRKNTDVANKMTFGRNLGKMIMLLAN